MASTLIGDELVDIPGCRRCDQDTHYLATVEECWDYFGDWRPRRRLFHCRACGAYTMAEADPY